MRQIYITVLLLFVVCVPLCTIAREIKQTAIEPDDFKGFYAGGAISTNGWGGELRYNFNRKLTVRSGIETINYSRGFDYRENNINYDVTAEYNTGGISVLGDYYFTRNLYLSGGVLFNSLKPMIAGYATSGLDYGDITIPASMVGDFEITVEPALKVSPYGSMGLRNFFGKSKRIVLNTEIGMYYIGSPEVEIKATGLLAPTSDPAHGQKERLEKQIEQYKFYPVVKLTLGVKLF